MGPYPQRKVITFNRYSHDFNFHINYGDLGFLGPEDLRVFGSQNLTTVKLKGVGESFKKYPDYESKGIKAHFNLDESGVLSLDRVRVKGNPIWVGVNPGPPASLSGFTGYHKTFRKQIE